MATLGQLRALVLRPDTPDCDGLAEGLAAAAESAHWHLLEPPSNSFLLSGTGVFMFASPTTVTEPLEKILTKVLNSHVGVDPLSLIPGLVGPDGQPVDIVIYIGPKAGSATAFLQEGNKTIPGGLASVAVRK
jgi:hypothetical protein